MLTPFQQQVKELVEQGKMLKDIAVELGYSVYQVQTCARQLRQKGILPQKSRNNTYTGKSTVSCKGRLYTIRN